MANMNFGLKLSLSVLLVLIGFGFSLATPGHHHHYHAYKPIDYYHYPKYTYSYGVNDWSTGDVKSAHETRDGGVTKGSYSVLQPDGIMRIVEYTADSVNGFQAVVRNKGYAHHPTYVHKPVVKAIVPAVVIKKPSVHHHHHYDAPSPPHPPAHEHSEEY